MSAPDISTAECLYGAEEIEQAIERMAHAIDQRLGGRDCLVLCVLQGGIVPAGLLLPRIAAPLQLDSVHITRYRDTVRGGEVEWLASPRSPVAGRRILLIDDILDEGHSLAALHDWLGEEGAREIMTTVLVDKRHERKEAAPAIDFRGLEVPDRYVFGFGMDYHGWHRNAPGIYALPE